jgi:hypothetical protein
MQYGLAIIFETQLSHKTGVLISDCGLKPWKIATGGLQRRALGRWNWEK